MFRRDDEIQGLPVPFTIKSKRGDEFIGHKLDANGLRLEGTLKYANGDMFIGSLFNLQREGEDGEMIYANGETYYGEWDHDKMNGEGTMNYLNGDEYSGDWVNDKKEGLGNMTYAPDDEVYMGLWKQDKREGQGAMFYKNGDGFFGEWKNDKKEGRGTFTYANDGRTFQGTWVNDVIQSSSSSIPKESILDLPSKVIDIENDHYSLPMSHIDAYQKDTPIVYLAGKDLYVFTKNIMEKVVEDNTTILYECGAEGGSIIRNVPYFNLRRLFPIDGLVPLNLLLKTIMTPPNKKTAVRQRYRAVTLKINSLAKNIQLPFSAKKKNIKEILMDNKLPPTMYTFVPTRKKKIDRLVSKAVAADVPDSAIGGFHCQDQGGMKWTIYTIVQVVAKRRRRSKLHHSQTKVKISKSVSKKRNRLQSSSNNNTI